MDFNESKGLYGLQQEDSACGFSELKRIYDIGSIFYHGLIDRKYFYARIFGILWKMYGELSKQ